MSFTTAAALFIDLVLGALFVELVLETLEFKLFVEAASAIRSSVVGALLSYRLLAS